eukprot:CAMPEP_0114551462 /NCGR_PEP_ID=MMETSP0114-20121206/6619_1 /TAXON_ID=31324 /ORGANISM="Goniomonas sp, Strain m" /LENGTH=193 /DNA_ID=CAMNT_0001736303 /DNA_START=347 /DNA_END=929 /DNA_ORIENTATION=-
MEQRCYRLLALKYRATGCDCSEMLEITHQYVRGHLQFALPASAPKPQGVQSQSSLFNPNFEARELKALAKQPSSARDAFAKNEIDAFLWEKTTCDSLPSLTVWVDLQAGPSTSSTGRAAPGWRSRHPVSLFCFCDPRLFHGGQGQGHSGNDGGTDLVTWPSLPSSTAGHSSVHAIVPSLAVKQVWIINPSGWP